MENNNQTPWWLPGGSIRAVLAVMVIGSLCYAFLQGLEVPDRFWDLSLLIAGAYFVTKVLAVIKK